MYSKWIGCYKSIIPFQYIITTILLFRNVGKKEHFQLKNYSIQPEQNENEWELRKENE